MWDWVNISREKLFSLPPPLPSLPHPIQYTDDCHCQVMISLVLTRFYMCKYVVLCCGKKDGNISKQLWNALLRESTDMGIPNKMAATEQ